MCADALYSVLFTNQMHHINYIQIERAHINIKGTQMFVYN